MVLNFARSTTVENRIRVDVMFAKQKTEISHVAMFLGSVWVFPRRIILVDLSLKYGTNVRVRQDTEEDTCQCDGRSI